MSSVYAQPPLTGGMIATSSAGERTRESSAKSWFTASADLASSGARAGSRRTSSARRSATVALRGNPIRTAAVPAISRAAANSKTVMVISVAHQFAERSPQAVANFGQQSVGISQVLHRVQGALAGAFLELHPAR